MNHLRVIEGSPWKQALACIINPGLPLSPWRDLDKVEAGDFVVLVLDTEPRTVVVGVNVRSGVAREIAHSKAIHFSALRTVAEVQSEAKCRLPDGAGLPLDIADAHAIALAVNALGNRVPERLLGHSSAAAARIMLSALGHCTCCRWPVDVSTPHAVEELTVHPVSERDFAEHQDWPALLCTDCATALRDGDFADMPDFFFSRQPACPVCAARRTHRLSHDTRVNTPPWVRPARCVERPDRWACGDCQYSWS